MVSNARHYPNSLLRIFLGQLVNQSHLAGATYCNRGVSAGGADVAAIAKAYVVSISTAVPIAFVAAVSAQRWTVLRPLARYAPYPGVAAANALACVTMRQADVADGIPVFGSAAGAPAEQLGTSRVAGWAAVRDTALTRLCMPVGNFLIVPSLLYALQRPNRALGFGPQIAVTASIFCCWLPFSASLFPPTGTLPVTALEEELRAHLERVGVREANMFFDILKKKGDPVEVVVKTFDGDITVQGYQGGEMIKAMEQSGVIFGCKEGTCGSCEVKLEGRVFPKKPMVNVDITDNELLKSRRED
eukprot:jgi/Chrpa1/26219/Chrysochromulina_OHIO_Genome00010927-RA